MVLSIISYLLPMCFSGNNCMAAFIFIFLFCRPQSSARFYTIQTCFPCACWSGFNFSLHLLLCLCAVAVARSSPPNTPNITSIQRGASVSISKLVVRLSDGYNFNCDSLYAIVLANPRRVLQTMFKKQFQSPIRHTVIGPAWPPSPTKSTLRLKLNFAKPFARKQK